LYTTRLFDEVWGRDRCAGCSLCVAACSKQVLYWDETRSAHPQLQAVQKTIGLSKFTLDTCSFCEHFCEQVCPQLEPAARLTPLATMAARATGLIGGGEPNDVARNILIAGRAAGMIDGAIVVDAERDGRTRARIVTSAGEIAESAGFQLVWTPVLEALNTAVFDLGLKSIALVATPCAAQAIRRLTDSSSPRLELYRRSIRLNVALFCTGVFMPEAFGELLRAGANLIPASIRRVTAHPREGVMRAHLWNGDTYEMPLAETEAFTRAGCARCDDFLGESADIAIGSAGAPENFSTLVVRTAIGKAFVENARAMQFLETQALVDEDALERAAAGKDRRSRAQAFDALNVLMLDALRDPRKRAQVRQQFDLLYGRPRASTTREDYRYAGCDDCSGC
jgi:coenzyme F420 hydrogenase subunit beta